MGGTCFLPVLAESSSGGTCFLPVVAESCCGGTCFLPVLAESCCGGTCFLPVLAESCCGGTCLPCDCVVSAQDLLVACRHGSNMQEVSPFDRTLVEIGGTTTKTVKDGNFT